MIALRIIAVLFAVAAVSDLRQIADAFGAGAAPPTLGIEHALVGAAALAAAVGFWRAARWAGTAALAWGVLAAIMIASLPAILPAGDIPRAAWPGLAIGSVVVLLLAAGAALLARRHQRHIARQLARG
ncbi:MAG TPA: hypothetical protein VJU87_07020 [Gemmatimonadaceae bacterium]|nr:hypothetical protein [Gemmatimonadaceae bacterium]